MRWEGGRFGAPSLCTAISAAAGAPFPARSLLKDLLDEDLARLVVALRDWRRAADRLQLTRYLPYLPTCSSDLLLLT